MGFDVVIKALEDIIPHLEGALQGQASTLLSQIKESPEVNETLEKSILTFASELETLFLELSKAPERRKSEQKVHEYWIKLGAAFFKEKKYFTTLESLVAEDGQSKKDEFAQVVQELLQLKGLPTSNIVTADDLIPVLVWSVAAAMSGETAEPARMVMLAEALAPYTAAKNRNAYVAAHVIGAIFASFQIKKNYLECNEKNRDQYINFLVMSCIVGHPEINEAAFNDLKDWFCNGEEQLRKIDILYRCHMAAASTESQISHGVTGEFLQKFSPFSGIENHQTLLQLLRLACSVQNQPLADTLANKIFASQASTDDRLTAISYYKERWNPEHSEIKQHLNKLMLSHGLQKLSPSDKHTPAINLIKHEQDKLNNRNWFFVAASAAVCSSVIILDSCAKVNIAHMAALALKSSLLGAGAVLSVQALCTWHKEGRGIKALSQLALGLAAVTCSVITLGQADAVCMLANKALLGAAGICLLGWALIDALEIKWIRSEGACSNGNQKPLTPSVHPA